MVSIIVPVYKCENSLRRCVESILAQTYENIELILVDDGSPDGSGALCDLLAERDARIRVIHKENGGPSSARNRGLDAAKGTYIQFVDSDDYIAPDMTARLVERMQQQDVQMVVCGLVYVHPDREERRQFADIPRVSVREMASRIPHYFENWFPNSPCTKLYQRRFIDFRFDENTRLGEDLMFNLAYFRRIEGVSVLDMCPYYYIVDNPGSLTGSVRVNRFTDVQVYFRAARDFYREMEQEEAVRQTARGCMEGILYGVLGALADAHFSEEEKRRLVKETLATDTVEEILSLSPMSLKQRLVAFFVRTRCYSALRLLVALYAGKGKFS